MGSTTRMVRSARLAADPEIALTVLRLMMAMNDIGVANDGLQEWDATENPKKKNRKDGGKLYFGRMQMRYHVLLNHWRLGGPCLTLLPPTPGFTHGSARRPPPGTREPFISYAYMKSHAWRLPMPHIQAASS
jgi:hypothetical protein